MKLISKVKKKTEIAKAKSIIYPLFGQSIMAIFVRRDKRDAGTDCNSKKQ